MQPSSLNQGQQQNQYQVKVGDKEASLQIPEGATDSSSYCMNVQNPAQGVSNCQQEIDTNKELCSTISQQLKQLEQVWQAFAEQAYKFLNTLKSQQHNLSQRQQSIKADLSQLEGQQKQIHQQLPHQKTPQQLKQAQLQISKIEEQQQQIRQQLDQIDQQLRSTVLQLSSVEQEWLQKETEYGLVKKQLVQQLQATLGHYQELLDLQKRFESMQIKNQKIS